MVKGCGMDSSGSG